MGTKNIGKLGVKKCMPQRASLYLQLVVKLKLKLRLKNGAHRRVPQLGKNLHNSSLRR